MCPTRSDGATGLLLVDKTFDETKKWIDDLPSQFDCLPYLMGDPSQVRFDAYRAIQADMGADGVVGLCIDLPVLMWQMRQPVEGAFYDYYDHHDLVAERGQTGRCPQGDDRIQQNDRDRRRTAAYVAPKPMENCS